MVRTQDSHSCNTGSTPVSGTTNYLKIMQNIYLKFKSYKLSLPICILVCAVLLSFLIVFGVFDKIFIKKSFEKAFFYRVVGNCDEFVNYIFADKEKWRERCLNEKTRKGGIPIKDFKVLRVDYSRKDNKAFLQVQLTRDEKPYVLNYEVVKIGMFTWEIANEM